ncbi:Ankyrin-1 [Branchiostoma belcheri]|nr:Ankyrin-1 [Branchiostoma belcheri]
MAEKANEALLHAATIGCLQDVKAALKSGVDIDYTQERNEFTGTRLCRTALYIACLRGIPTSATLDTQDCFRRTPLMMACMFKRVDTARRLIELGARVDLADASGLTAQRSTLKLCGACKLTRYCSRDCQRQHWLGGHKKCCGHDAYSDEMRDRDFRKFAMRSLGNTRASSGHNSSGPGDMAENLHANEDLIYAAQNGCLQGVRAALKAGAEVDYDQLGRGRVIEQTALFMASVYGNVDMVKLLIRKGAFVSKRASGASSAPLHAAASQVKAVYMWFPPKPVSKAPCERSEIALKAPRAQTTSRGGFESVSPHRDLRLNAMTSFTASGGTTAAFGRRTLGGGHQQAGHTEVVDLLVYHGATLDIRDAEQRTPLMDACMFKQPDTVRQLIELGARVDLTDHKGATTKRYCDFYMKGEDLDCTRKEMLELIEEALKTRLLR